ncbi:uncharacterized protein [Parasteatoda tepidariorum]|uniref:uncharacterized protein n=1 Tax=Parasteatoda tepidariorum TaxID=114398 RepID=UPI00077F9A18|nr:uncharacterized protein LOC107441355 [Parasteatoda tepidariorum]
MHKKMDFHSVMESFAEAWVVANTHTPLTEAAESGLINGPNNNSTSSNQAQPPPQPSSNLAQPLPQPPSNLAQPLPQPPPNLAQPLPPPSSTAQDIPKDDCIVINEDKQNSRCQSPPESLIYSPSNADIKIKVIETHGKSLPVHCIIEQNPGPQACGQYVELDSYAIVPCETLFSDLVRTALGKLGYSGSQIVGAKGSIQIKKWKPLAFDQVTENPDATVADILGDLTTMASLHIRLYSVPDNPQEWKDVTVRNAVLELLREMSQSKLAKLCPLSQPMLSNIINNRYLGKIGKEKCQEFGTWYLNYRKQTPEGTAPEIVPSDRPTDGRLTFHPTKELPTMRDWFRSCRNPSRRTLQMYVDILNQGPVRQQERPKIILSTLKNWWKNEKQRERKQHSEDKSPDAITAKRKKKSDQSTEQKEAVANNGNHDHTSPNCDDAPKTNNFTLINHSENENDFERVCRRDSEVSENSLVSDSSLPFQKLNSSDSKSNSKFTFLSSANNVSEMERFIQKDTDLQESRLNEPGIEPSKALPIESSYFHKIHTVCIEPSMHNVFNFTDPQLSIHPNPKMYSSNPLRTNAADNNSHMSSEEDVDVGI